MRKGRVTLTSIARETGKSPQTVSKILHGGASNTNVSDATRRLVEETARRMGYKVNQIARAVRQGRVGSLGMLFAIDSHRSQVYHYMIAGAVCEAEKRGFDLKIMHYEDEELRGDNIPRVFRETLVDGLLVNYCENSNFTEKLEKELRQHELPAIWMNRDIAEDCVNYDDFNAGFELTRRMISDGIRKITYFDFNYDEKTNHYSQNQRAQGYKTAMSETGFTPLLELQNVSRRESQHSLECFRQFYKKHSDMEAVIVYGRTIGPVILKVLWENNREIGRDVFVGYFGHPNDFTLYPSYVMVQPEWTFGKTAVKVLCDKIKKPTTPITTHSVRFQDEIDHPPHVS